MKTLIITFLALFIAFESFSQVDKNKYKEYKEVKGFFHHENNVIPDIFPTYPGGTDGLLHYIAHNVKYPEKAKENRIQGEVIVQYVVSKDGSVKDVKIIKSLSPEIDKECIRLVKEMKGWKPGRKNGEAVNIAYKQPIVFKLPD